MLAVGCAPECCSGAPHVKPWALSTDELDLELKLLCWNAAAAGCVLESEVLSIAQSMGLMSGASHVGKSQGGGSTRISSVILLDL